MDFKVSFSLFLILLTVLSINKRPQVVLDIPTVCGYAGEGSWGGTVSMDTVIMDPEYLQ